MVQVPGTNLDTQNATDRVAITDHIGRELLTDADLHTFVTALANLPNRTPYEQNIFTGAFVRWVRRADANAVYTQARQGGVWCKGRVIIDTVPYGTEVPLVQAGTPNDAGAYVNPQHIFNEAQLEATRRDAEVSVLDSLSNILTASNWANLGFFRVLLTGSQGPCGMCQRRIQAFIADLNAIAYAHYRQRDPKIRLIFEANSTTAYQPNVSQRGLPTQYGYQDATTITIAPASPESYTFWSKVFEVSLGSSSTVNF